MTRKLSTHDLEPQIRNVSPRRGQLYLLGADRVPAVQDDVTADADEFHVLEEACNLALDGVSAPVDHRTLEHRLLYFSLRPMMMMILMMMMMMKLSQLSLASLEGGRWCVFKCRRRSRGRLNDAG